MTIGAVLIGIALALVVILYVARPLLEPKSAKSTSIQSDRQALIIQKEAILEEIRRLDFDHDTGKIPDHIYEEERAVLMQKAATVLEEIDRLSTDDSATIDIETAVAAMRRQPPKTANGGGFCPQCGNPVDADDKFCPKCGHKLVVSALEK